MTGVVLIGKPWFSFNCDDLDDAVSLACAEFENGMDNYYPLRVEDESGGTILDEKALWERIFAHDGYG